MIYVFSAYPDAAVMGCGGAISEYVRSGEAVTAVIFSYGENTNPLLDPAYLTSRLKEASKKAFDILGCKAVFLALPDRQLGKQIRTSGVKQKIRAMFRRFPPKIILTHDVADVRPSHRAVTKLVQAITRKLRLKARIYTFGVDLPIKIFYREVPKMYVDITRTVAAKERALKAFHAHGVANQYYQVLTKVRDKVYGLRIGEKWSEAFYQVQ